MNVIGIEGTAHTFSVGIFNGREILSLASRTFRPEKGGIHPREAADHHASVSGEIIREAVEKSGLNAEDIELVAFSQGPGLGPCLRVAATVARTISIYRNIPIVGVNHCMAHMEIGKFLTGARNPVMLYASGGNTQIIALAGGRYRVFGETMDIGIGNMLDKFARESGIPFPGGPEIEKLALKAEKYLPLPYSVRGMDVSFSGLLTAALHLRKRERMEDIAYSIQETAFAMLTEVTERAMAHLEKDEVLLGGGVACNKRLREMVKTMAEERGARFHAPDCKYCVDNGAMIALLGHRMYEAGYRMKIEDTVVRQRFRTDEVDVIWD